MGEIEIVEGKTLKLNNVLHRLIDAQKNEYSEKTIRMFESYAKANGLQCYGPMIIRTKTTISDGRVVQHSDLMVQLREAPTRIDDPYEFDESIRVENCLMARFRGQLSAIQVAYGKMNVYSFEHDLNLTDTVFTIFIDHLPDGDVVADIFSEVKS